MKGPKRRKSPSKAETAPMPGGMISLHDDMKYQAQDALHTLKRAHEIKGDQALMGHVKKHAAKEREALSSIMRRKT